MLISDARALLTRLCESQLNDSQLEAFCAQEVEGYRLAFGRIIGSYLVRFVGE